MKRKTNNQDIEGKREPYPKVGLNIQSKIYPADEILDISITVNSLHSIRKLYLPPPQN